MRSTAEANRTEAGPGSQSSLRHSNELRVLTALREEGELTQAQLARRTSLAPSTISGIVHDLSAAGLVHVEEEHGGRRGRQVRLALDGRYLAAVDVGHAHVSVALATMAEEIVGVRSAALQPGHAADNVLHRVSGFLDELVAEVGAARSAVVAAGLSVPAPLNNEGWVLGAGMVLPGWAGADLAGAAAHVLGVPCRVENDANVGAVAESRHGAGHGVDNFVYLKVGHGIGAGLILDGELFRGATGVSGEIGHTMIDEHGAFCRCGNRGCLETVASASAVVSMLQEVHPEISSLQEVILAARSGDKACARALTDTGRVVGVAVANLCNILNPELVVIGGLLAEAGELILEPLREVVDRHGVRLAVAELRIVTSGLGERTQLLGATGLAAAVSAREALQR